MNEIQTLPTFYAGTKFRSRLEARWAIFFDHCGIKWEYEPEGYLLEDGTCYLPDFLLHGLVGRVEGDLFVEVKGKLTEEDAKKISMFINGKKGINIGNGEMCHLFARPLLLVGNIFTHNGGKGYISRCFDMWCDERCPGSLEYFSYTTIDGDCFGCALGVNHNGEAETFGADSSYTCDCNEITTEAAFFMARNAQFTRQGKYIG